MEFIVKLPTNTNDVNQANQKNAEIQAHNDTELKKVEKHRQLKELLEVPELLFVERPLLVDVEKITLAHINQLDEIQFNYEGQIYKAKLCEIAWGLLKKRFNVN